MKRRHVILKRKKKVIIRFSIRFQVVTGNFHRNETNHTNAPQLRGRRGLSYQKVRDAIRLALGYKSRVLVSLRIPKYLLEYPRGSSNQ